MTRKTSTMNYIESFDEDMKSTITSLAIPNWFDKMLAEDILPKPLHHLYEHFCNLSIIEQFSETTLCINSEIRKDIIEHYWEKYPDTQREISHIIAQNMNSRISENSTETLDKTARIEVQIERIYHTIASNKYSPEFIDSLTHSVFLQSNTYALTQALSTITPLIKKKHPHLKDWLDLWKIKNDIISNGWKHFTKLNRLNKIASKHQKSNTDTEALHLASELNALSGNFNKSWDQFLSTKIEHMNTTTPMLSLNSNDIDFFISPTPCRYAHLGFNIPARIPKFLGRELETKSIISWIRESTSNNIMQIVGTGGIGKTHLTHYIVSKVLKEGFPKNISWISAKDNTFFRNDAIQCPHRPSTHEIINSLSNLAYHTNKGPNHASILVIDNIDSISNINEVFAQLSKIPKKTKVLLTSRTDITPEPIHTIRLYEISEFASKKLLTYTPKNLAMTLSPALQHPLTLNLIHRIISEQHEDMDILEKAFSSALNFIFKDMLTKTNKNSKLILYLMLKGPPTIKRSQLEQKIKSSHLSTDDLNTIFKELCNNSFINQSQETSNSEQELSLPPLAQQFLNNNTEELLLGATN